MTGDDLSSGKRALKESPQDGSDRNNHRDPPESKLQEVVEVPDGSEFSLGPGIGFIGRNTVLRVISFHGYLTTGAFIGLQMLALGRRLLGVEENEKIHVVCETRNCLPDPFQVLAGATVGNKRLVVRDTGKVAVTITRHTPPGEKAPGVRIVLDATKTEKFEKLHAWYMNTEDIPHREVVKILREAGDTVYSYEYLKVPVVEKQEKHVSVCTVCGEPFIQSEGGRTCCVDCRKPLPSEP